MSNESASRSDGMERLKVREQEIENAANELDQLFRQRHKHDDVTHLLKRLVNRCDAPVSERGTLSAVKQFVRGWMHECPNDTPTVKRLCELNALLSERNSGT